MTICSLILMEGEFRLRRRRQRKRKSTAAGARETREKLAGSAELTAGEMGARGQIGPATNKVKSTGGENHGERGA